MACGDLPWRIFGGDSIMIGLEERQLEKGAVKDFACDIALVSVMIPYYDGSLYIREAVESVLNQTYGNIELIVVDDGSSCRQESEYIESLSREMGFELIVHPFNTGSSRALMDAFYASSGEYIAILSQDDTFRPEKIEKQVKEIESKGYDAVYVSGDVEYKDSGRVVKKNIDRTVRCIQSGEILEPLRVQNFPGVSIQGLLAKRCVFENDIAEIWSNYLLDDWPVNIRLFEKYNVGFMDANLWRKGLHSDNTSWDIWKWLGPQIEVVARMAPDELKTEAIGNRVASMARRLLRQNGDHEAIVRFALAGLILCDSAGQYKKASRVLSKLPRKEKKAIAALKCQQIEDVCRKREVASLPEKIESLGWDEIGKAISDVTISYEGNDRISEIGKLFLTLAVNLSSKNRESVASAIRFALAGMVLTDNPDGVGKVAGMLQLARGEYGEIIKDKCRLVRAKSGRSARKIWLN